MLSYKKKDKPESFKEACQKIKDKIREDYKDWVDLLFKGEGPLVPLLLSHTLYTIVDKEVVMKFSDRASLSVSRDYADMFYFIFKWYHSMSVFNLLLDSAIEGVGYDSYDFEKNIKNDVESDDGQAKIMLSTLLPMCNSPPDVNVLVIGSSSPNDDGTGSIISGRTYEALGTFLSLAGYRGDITCIDPYESNLERDCGNIKLHFKKGSFSWDYPYRNNRPFTHVYDDVWLLRKLAVVRAIPRYYAKNISLKEGDYKFSYTVHNRVLVFRHGLSSHDELDGALGGGHLKKEGRKLYFYGTSNKVGHYSDFLLRDIFRDYEVTIDPCINKGRESWDGEGRIFSLYSTSRVSCKFFGEKYNVNGQVVDQTWYNGTEKRFIYNCPDVCLDESAGCGCEHCAYYEYIRENFRVYKDNFSVDSMLSSVINDKCVASKGNRVNRVTNYLIAASRGNHRLSDVVEEIKQKYDIDHSTIYRIAALAIRFKKINVLRMDCEKLKEFNCYNEVNGEKRYYNDVGEYIVQHGSKFEYPVKKSRLVSTTRNDKERDAVDYFYQSFSTLFCFIAGYEDKVCTGEYTCGLTDDYEYQITTMFSSGTVVSVFENFLLIKH